MKQFRLFFPVIFLLTISPVSGASIFDPPYKKIAESIVESVQKNNKSKVAVLAFQSLDQENTREGEIISEEIIYELIKNGSVHVVERQQIRRLMDELQLNQSGMIDAETAKTIGNGLGADALVIGNFTAVNEKQLKIYAKVVDTETFKVLSAHQEMVKRVKPDEESIARKEAQKEAMWSKFEIALISGLVIPEGTISGTYNISATDIILTDTISHSFSGAITEASVPLALRTSIWLNKVFGLGADLGFNYFKFSPQTLAVTSTLEDYLGATSSVTRNYTVDATNYYQINNLYLGLNLLVRIPIDANFYPYAGIGYRFSFQSIAYNGSGQDFLDPLSNRELGMEFAFSPGLGSLQTVLRLFTYIVGVEWFFTDTVGLMAQYQLIHYGEARYFISRFANFTYTDPDLGTIGGTSSTLEMIVDPITAHNIHVALVFKF